MNRTLYFVRHGQTDWNAEFRFQGQQDIPINALGRQQAERNGETLRAVLTNPEAFDFVSSPLSRTRQTMEIIRGKMGLPHNEYGTDKRLLELNYGDWEGQTIDEMQRSHGEMSEARNRNKWEFVPPGNGAESYAMLSLRFESWLNETLKHTVCVTHGGVLRCIWRLIGGLSADEAGKLIIPQDRILQMKNERLEWI